MPPMPPDKPTKEDITRLYSLSAKQNKALLAKEQEAVQELIAAYSSAWKRLEAQLGDIRRELARRKRAGEDAGYRLMVQSRLERLQTQIEAELKALGQQTADLTTGLQRDFVVQAQVNAEMLLAEQGVSVETGVNLSRLNTAAFEKMVGFLGNGTPLTAHLEKIAGEHAAKLGSLLTDSFAEGKSGARIAREAQAAFSTPFDKGFRVARTETMRAYNSASNDYYRANADVIVGWLWDCALDSRACAACVSMHGSFHGNDEELFDHVLGRCVAIPVTSAYRDSEALGSAGIDAQEWVDRQDEETQTWVFGSHAAVEAYRAGEVELQDFAGQRDSEEWGNSIERRSLVGAREAAAERQATRI